MRVLIVDDEPLARTALINCIAARSDVEAMDAACDAVEAEAKLSAGSYDVMLLDVRMPELSGRQLLDRLEARGVTIPAIIFVTAHDKYVAQALEKQALDYVPKPFSNERINRALDAVSRRSAAENAAKLLELLPLFRATEHKPSPKIAIKSQGRIIFIQPGDVYAVQAEGNYVLLHRDNGSYLLRESISEVETKLRPHGFVRIHRSVLVNRACVEEILTLPTGEYTLHMRGGKRYPVTRKYKKNLKTLAESWIGTDAPLSEE
jgi:two-component system LytT family response regulator